MTDTAYLKTLDEVRAKWAKLLVVERSMDIKTRLLISLFLEDIKRLDKE